MSGSPNRLDESTLTHDADTNTSAPIPPHGSDEPKYPYLIIIAGSHVGELHKLTRTMTTVGRSPGAQIRIIDEGVSREHIQLIVEGTQVRVRDLGSTNGTFCNGARVDTQDLADGDKISIGSTTILKFSYQDGIDEAYQRDLYKSAVKDPVTGALKKDFFIERLEEEVAFALRHRSPLALIFWDLDRFKSVNDTYGHQVGDRVLVATSQAVAAQIRREDVLARYGGEEFALACRATPVERALAMAERLRKALAEASVDLGSAPLHVSASFGVAMCPADGITTAAELVTAADRAMYRAKSAGRNRVELAIKAGP